VKNKKGYFFLMDGIFAIVILVIGGLIVSSNTVQESTDIPLTMYLDNTVDLFSTVKINELCATDCTCSNEKLEELCTLNLNQDQTLSDYFGELYSLGREDDIEDLFVNLTIENEMLRQDVFSVELRIDDDQIYFHGKNQINSKELISSKKVIFGYIEHPDGMLTYWGPYVMEVNIWD
jgi:hypothetical protein